MVQRPKQPDRHGASVKNATAEQTIQSATALLDIADDLMGSDVDMSRVMSGLSQYGITSPAQAQAMADKLLNSIPAGQMPVTLPAAQARFEPGANQKGPGDPAGADAY